ncbi:hypothetical protein [uncultured Aquimarina sp.]|uniref:hypothetical protein n=1 Tax=uncultured Aquimarina sp. TaxID=575652 RepID=UPI002620FB8E|nr:hypothetical protein [uncultured Aquimarina sp.]
MEHQLTLGVYRRLDNRSLGISDDSEMALELHNKRKDALLDVFEDKEHLQVKDWGETKDTKPHEFTELVIGIVGTAVFNYAIVPGLKYLGEKLAEKLVDDAITNSVKWIIAKLRPKQKSKEILNFQITLPDGTSIYAYPIEGNSSITIHFKDGNIETIQYDSQNS